MSQTTGLHVNPSDETFHLGPLVVRFLLTGDHSTGSVAAFELLVPAAQRLAAPAHSHDHYEETAYLRVLVGDKRRTLTEGECVMLPGGVPRGFLNVGPAPGRFLCLVDVEQIGEIFDLPLTVTLDYTDRRTVEVVVPVTDRVVDSFVFNHFQRRVISLSNSHP